MNDSIRALLATCGVLLVALLVPFPATAQNEMLIALHPHPKSAFPRDGTFRLTPDVDIVISAGGDTSLAEWLREEIRLRSGATLDIITFNEYDGAGEAILLALEDEPLIAGLLSVILPPGEPAPSQLEDAVAARDAYVLDATSDKIVIAAADRRGLRNGAATLVQLIQPAKNASRVSGVHVWDYPDYPVRRVFSSHNLRGPGAMNTLRDILDTMVAYKLNGIQQNDFKYDILEEQPDFYFDSVARFKGMLADRGLEVIPGVVRIGWSSGILWRDPNLAEGFAARARYVVEADTARIIPDPRVRIVNGGFENTDGSGRLTGWNFYDEGSVTVDRSIVHSGGASARCEDFTNGNPAGNSRFNVRVDCEPNRHYVMTAWVRAEDLSCDEVRLLAIGQDDNNASRVLTHTAFNIRGTTNGWKRLEVRFNTLEFNHLLLYCGVWGGRSGTIWWDDFAIRDAGLTNVLRREGTPLHVYDAESGEERIEGVDFLPIEDAMMLANHGEYGPYHEPPTLRRASAGSIVNGDTLEVTWFHPLTTVADETGSGSVMVCLSEERLYAILREQLEGVNELYQPRSWFMGHDEIRSMNHDSACLERNASPASLLADNVRRSAALIDSISPGADIYVWSDMFDSLHNAHDDYYLINGDLSGVWDSIPTSLTIVNWNGGRRRESLDFFARRGFRQVASPYYDTRDEENIREWRLALEETPGATGMMYTTWSADYDFLRPFAYYAWGAGPYIIHVPLRSDSVQKAVDGGSSSIPVVATILADPYDAGDEITIAEIRLFNEAVGSDTIVIPMSRAGAGMWEGEVPVAAIEEKSRYAIAARNDQGLERLTPWYRVDLDVASVADRQIPAGRLIRAASVGPDESVILELASDVAGRIEIYDTMGRLVRCVNGEEAASRIVVDVSKLPSGRYGLVVRAGDRSESTTIVITR